MALARRLKICKTFICDNSHAVCTLPPTRNSNCIHTSDRVTHRSPHRTPHATDTAIRSPASRYAITVARAIGLHFPAIHDSSRSVLAQLYVETTLRRQQRSATAPPYSSACARKDKEGGATHT